METSLLARHSIFKTDYYKSGCNWIAIIVIIAIPFLLKKTAATECCAKKYMYLQPLL